MDLRTGWLVFEEERGLMGVSPETGISLGSLWFFQTKSGVVVTTSVSFFWVLKYRSGMNCGCRREEMQSAAMLSRFCPLLPTTLNKGIAQTPRNYCFFCYSGVFCSLAICLAAMFFLIPPRSPKINVSAPPSTSCNSLTESPADISPVSFQDASHDPLLACTVCFGMPPPLL